MKRAYLITLAISFLFISCNNEEISPSDSFLKIYDDKDYNAEYNPIGLGQSDSSIFILSERSLNSSNFAGIKLIITNRQGDFLSETDLEEQFVAPTPELIKIGDIHYFFCMDKNTLRPYLGSISSDGSISLNATSLNTSYPLAINKNNQNQLILLSYHQEDKNSTLSIISTDGAIIQQADYTIGAGNDVLEAITTHLTQKDEKIPFYCGQAPDQKYYFNGFYNFTLSTVFTTLGEDPTGVIQGQSTNAGFKSFLPIEADNYAFIAFQFSDTYINSYTQLNSSTISSSSNYISRKIPEVRKGSTTEILAYEYSGRNLTVIAAETEGRQVVLYFHEANTGELINTYFLGTLNPFTFADIVAFEDGSLGVVGTTFLADRFERIYLQKISSEQLNSIL